MKREDLKCEAGPEMCPRNPRGFRNKGVETCKGCPMAKIKKWDWIKGQETWEEYHD